MDLKQMFQETVNMSHNERVNLAKASISKLAQELKNDDLTLSFLVGLATICSATDGKVSDSERQLFNDLTGANLSFEEFFNLVSNNTNEEAFEVVNNAVDSLTNDGKSAAVLFALAFLAADEQLTTDEQKLFAILLD